MFIGTLGMRLRGAYLGFHRRANQHLLQYGVTADQFVVLTALAEAEGLTQRELVERVYSDANTIAGMLARLEKRKLIRRQPHAEDGRARCVFLTTLGRRTQQKLVEVARPMHAALEAQFTRQELDLLRELLGRVAVNYAPFADSAVNQASEV